MNPATGKKPSSVGVVLLVDEDLEQLESLRGVIQGVGYQVQACNSYTEGIRHLAPERYDLIVVGQGGSNFAGRGVVEGATAVDRSLPVIVVARHLDIGCYLDAMQLGAVDYLAGGFVEADLARAMQTHTRHRKSQTGGAKNGRSSGPTELTGTA